MQRTIALGAAALTAFNPQFVFISSVMSNDTTASAFSGWSLFFALRTARRVLAEGKALLVFPEGTRGEEGTLREPKPGAALLAVQSGATVVPAYVSGTGRAWPRGRRLPRPVKVVVTFGAPLRFTRATGADRKAQYEAASGQMMAAIADLRDRSVGGVGVAQARRPLQIH